MKKKKSLRQHRRYSQDQLESIVYEEVAKECSKVYLLILPYTGLVFDKKSMGFNSKDNKHHITFEMMRFNQLIQIAHILQLSQ